MRAIISLLLALSLAGCASKSATPVDKVSYRIGAEQTAILGVPFLTEEHGSIIHGQQWEGIAFGGMHHSYTKSDDYQLTELYYGGLASGKAVVVMQTLRGNESSPARQQYDIDLSGYGPHQVGPYSLDILSAAGGNMRYRVLGKK
ncbi:hypothetical protein D9M71_88320 [compost metagenome]